MHALMFCGVAEEAGTGRGFDAYAGAELDAMGGGDVLWLVGRLGAERQTPALLGRLVVQRIERHTGVHPFEAGQTDRARRLIAEPRSSERCRPVACPMIAAWGVWRHPFGGITPLGDEQGESLEQFWRDAADLRVPDAP